MATRTWQGDGVAIAQTGTATVANIWAADDTIIFTVNGKAFTLTIGTLVTVTQVAATIVEAINGTAFTDTTAAVNVAASTIPEFAEFTASSAVGVVTITSDTAGKPFNQPTCAETTVGTGSIGNFAEGVANSGPNDFDTPVNWSGDTVPVGGDTIVFDAGSVSLLYGLDQNALGSAVTVLIYQRYTGNIGLPLENIDGTAYSEYRERYLIIPATTLTIGQGSGNGSQRLNIDCDGENAVVNIENSGSEVIVGVPPILIKNTGATSSINITRGQVGVCFYTGETATFKFTKFGFKNSVLGDVNAVFGSGCTLAGTGFTLDQIGGTVEIDSATTLVDINGGELTIKSGAHASIDVGNGKAIYKSTGTLTAATVGSSGVLDLSRDMQGRTITNITLYKNSSFLDPSKTVTFSNPIQLPQTGVQELGETNFGNDIQLTVATI